MTLYDLAKVLGGTVNEKWINVPGPGHSIADKSLGFCFDPSAPGGFVVKSLAGDDEMVCRKHIKELLAAIIDGGAIAASVVPPKEDKAALKKIAAASQLWSQTTTAPGTLVEKYLTTRRCIIGDWDAVVRFHPYCPLGHVHAPAMVALVQNVITGEPQGVHRTAISDDGINKRVMPAGIAAKMMLGVVRGGAVTLGQAAPHLGIAEGIETALSAAKLFGVPVWALLSATGMSNFPIVPGVKRLTIFADNDEAGLKAAFACARRYHQAGIKGQIHHPPKAGQDWNDYLNEEAIKNEQ